MPEGEGYSINLTGLTSNLDAVQKAFRQFVKRLESYGTVTASIEPKSAAELHGTTDPRSTQGGQ